MQTALATFQANLGRVRAVGGLYDAISAQATPALDLSDLLRSQMVLIVSALDHFVHEAVRSGMGEVYGGTRAATPAYNRFAISLASVVQAAAGAPASTWLDSEIRARHGWQSFQKSEKVAEAIALISTKKLWDEVANAMGDTSKNVRARLDLVVDRRNKIAHEADMDPSFPGQRWPISKADVVDSVDFVERVVNAMVAIL
jgi:hypothetical protein